MKKLRENQKGFTLIELIVVVAILAILAAVAVPNFIGLTARAKVATEVAAAAEVANAINIYNTLNSATPIDGDATNHHPEAADITTLGTLAPTIDTSITVANVYARVTITSNIATVTDRD